MKHYTSIHEITAIVAAAPGSLGAPLVLQMYSGDARRGDVTFFLGDQALVERLVTAINGAVYHKCEPDLAHQEAHDAVTAYDYRGSNR